MKINESCCADAHDGDRGVAQTLKIVRTLMAVKEIVTVATENIGAEKS